MPHFFILTLRYNLQSETVLIQKVYTHFKKAPGTHKLGVLYVVDSVTRQWVEQAKKAGQPLGPTASDGTFAAGVNHVTELLPSFMSDIINSAPEDQKVRFLDTLLRATSPSIHRIDRIAVMLLCLYIIYPAFLFPCTCVRILNSHVFLRTRLG